uniref:RNA polymerase Rpb2 domain-containing protein n=1 Tax=Brassica oleracea TaxID=3712 RepID=A0A3P6HIK7_BRAOL|nr:unnamed protein product [Brassica oleracea]
MLSMNYLHILLNYMYPWGLIWKTNRNMQEQRIFIGNVPLMNSLGTSIVNGIYRVVINQILQSPGIYYQSELDHNRISGLYRHHNIRLGGRLELEIDKKARIWARGGIQYFLNPYVRNYKNSFTKGVNWGGLVAEILTGD